MIASAEAIKQNMSLFERYLTLWVAICIVVGVALGHYFSGAFQWIGGMEVALARLGLAGLLQATEKLEAIPYDGDHERENQELLEGR